MKKFIFITLGFYLVLCQVSFGQVEQETGGELDRRIQAEEEEGEIKLAHIEAYKLISVSSDTTHVDTSLTIDKFYQFNYLRRDNFELLPFPNVGQTYNRLAYSFGEEDNMLPEFGARARAYNFMDVEDVLYYWVPTPLTELYFKTVFEQGQTLDALFTVNTSDNLNLSIAYKGHRSLGIYQHMLVSTGNFRTTASYNSTNDRYHLKTHFVAQDLMNEENGGLAENSLEYFRSKNPEFEDRSRLEVRFQDAQSTLYGKRFFLDHSYELWENSLSVGHKLNYSYKKYQFQQEAAHEFFGPSFEEVRIDDETRLKDLYNEGFVELSGALGEFKVKTGLHNYEYGYNSVLELEEGFVENKIIGQTFSFGGEYQGTVGEFSLVANGMMNISGPFDGFFFESQLSYKLNQKIWGAIAIDLKGRAPNWNFLLNQSDYVNYNWRNHFSNVERQTAEFRLMAKDIVRLNASYNRIKNYTYFSRDENGSVQPYQYDGQVNYWNIKARRDFYLGKFALANTILVQGVVNGREVLHVPSFKTRNSFFYKDHWFERALFLQTGFTVNYFPGYRMDAYDPVLAEFFVQNEEEFQDHRTVDFFFNGKIQQTRIFFTLERVDALLLGNNYFAAPLYPYRDFAVRFGLVWNFFM